MSLFPEPARVKKNLSRLYSQGYNYARPGFKPRYTKIANQTNPHCDECFAEQHESRGLSGQRLEAKVRRGIKQGAALNLCRIHEELWKRRDIATGGPK